MPKRKFTLSRVMSEKLLPDESDDAKMWKPQCDTPNH